MILAQSRETLRSGGVNGIGHNGMSPLEAAKDGHNDEIVEYLLSMGAEEN